MSRASLLQLAYLAASVLFVLGLKGLAHPRTAVRANLLGALGMALAIGATFLDPKIERLQVIVAGLLVGSAVGAVLAQRVRMTAMPQLVALFNGLGGLASALVAGAELHEARHQGLSPSLDALVATVASGIVGAVTFTGSLTAYAKLEELKALERLSGLRAVQAVNALLGAAALAVGAFVVQAPAQVELYWALVAVASVLGVFLTLPIGGADMPVVIALLNSYSGIAASATGFVLGNSVLIVAGSLVGASGIILTQLMCRAMNRSLGAVLFGASQGSGVAAKGDDVYGGKVKSTSAEEVAMLFDTARRVVIVPGYGLAVAQAQHAVRELTHLLEAKGITVEFGIHPVAGRMPGHMNVLLAEADIPYEAMKELDEINASFKSTDVVLVVGANDVVNPLARTDPTSPIAGMPILDVDEARTVVVLKRSLSPGFAGIPNPLFAAENCLMLFADAKKGLLDLNAALKTA
jgi:NAD(P) transhydrogenase subunit beta